MELIIQTSRPVFDTTQIARGYLIFARHRSWNEGRGGIMTAVSADRLAVQFHPGIGNVMNHFFIPAHEVAGGEWEIRWSKDMTEISSVGDDSPENGDAQEDDSSQEAEDDI